MGNMALLVQNMEREWSDSQQEHPNPVLKQISLKIPKGCLIVIIGEVGVGRSSLLNVIFGEKGFNLSGGQRAQLALARVLSQDCDICLLDDTLSVVDAHVAAWILQNAILFPLLAHKTQILCTHNTQAIHMVNMVIVMEKGTIK
ncbi:hypothetical protein SUGI_1182530 [Cryptomeria japonica]|nr:hypothetical protein SUGI_1182530 [Cryptomeria japonica]